METSCRSTSPPLLSRFPTPPHKVGVPPNTTPHPAYAKAKGAELAFYGRGYVQLTWWNNYAKNGAAVGMGLELLFNPDRGLERDVAYKVMAEGIIYGVGYANRHKLQHYLVGGRADYVGARAIVNRLDPVPSIVRAAQLFEASLMASKA